MARTPVDEIEQWYSKAMMYEGIQQYRVRFWSVLAEQDRCREQAEFTHNRIRTEINYLVSISQTTCCFPSSARNTDALSSACKRRKLPVFEVRMFQYDSSTHLDATESTAMCERGHDHVAE
jgi:hypothetical protein